MYIISKQKDYYDGVVGSMGIDKTIVYEREFVEIKDYKDFPNEFRRNQPWRRGGENHFLNLGHYPTVKESKYLVADSFIVGFCGKLYLGWKFHWEEQEMQDYGGYSPVVKTKIIYGFENAKEHLKNERWSGNLVDDVNYVLSYDPMDIFRKYSTPIFIYDDNYNRLRILEYWGKHGGSRFLINPMLKKYEFYKVFDAFTAFQELQMFISGVLGTGEKEIIEVEDKYKIAQHGFDKWSFRKEPQREKK